MSRGAAPALVLLASLLVTTCVAGARDLQEPKGELWAVLVAGSAGWGNYRHQADIAHAYQILRHGGVPASRIITLMYDDVAGHAENPFPNQLFNRPHGPDVYEGIQIDYAGVDVTVENFLAVLAGNASALNLREGTANGVGARRSTGRVLATTPADKVFVYYSDHGAPGIVGMPSGPFLYADQLHVVVATKARHGGFAEMVIYMEACESGSMFEGLLEDNIHIYATTAANAHESSWGTYCPGMHPSPPPEFSTCLGDLYSIAWMENAEHANLTLETLKKQFQLVKQRVSQNFTYAQGSHVLRFGGMEISEEPTAEFQGELNTGDGTLGGSSAADAADVAGMQPVWAPQGAVAQRDADLLHLWHKYSEAPAGLHKAAALRQLNSEVSRRAAVDAGVAGAVGHLLSTSDALSMLRSRFGAAPGVAPLLRGAAEGPAAANALVGLLVNEALPRPAGAALVDDWECLRGMVGTWEAACGPLDQYGMKHARAFANLCNTGLAPAHLAAAAARSCPAPAESAVLLGPDAHILQA